MIAYATVEWLVIQIGNIGSSKESLSAASNDAPVAESSLPKGLLQVAPKKARLIWESHFYWGRVGCPSKNKTAGKRSS